MVELPLPALQEVCAHGYTVAFLSEEYRRVLYPLLPCDVIELPSSRRRNDLAFALAPGSPYTQLVSYYVRRMRRCGVLARLVDLYWPKALTAADSAPQRLPGVRLGDVAQLFAALAAGALLSLALLLAERLHHSHRTARLRKIAYVTSK